ncbi:MAG: four helix bundle protein [Chloroflexi bacterium]|nr:four helix bundle protein [Chloroflexota bacterium]
MRSFRNLKVWQKAHQAALSIYKTTRDFPKEEIYGLSSQLRRAASSIPANIAEGCGCNGSREFARFLEIALRSANETEYHLLLASDLQYLKRDAYLELNNQVIEIKRMLTILMQKLSADG